VAKNTAMKMFSMPFCAYFVADFDDLLAVLDRRFLHALELDIRLDELDGAVGACGNRLRRSAGEPVDHRPTGDQAQDERRMQEGKLVDVFPSARA